MCKRGDGRVFQVGVSGPVIPGRIIKRDGTFEIIAHRQIRPEKTTSSLQPGWPGAAPVVLWPATGATAPYSLRARGAARPGPARKPTFRPARKIFPALF